MTRRSPLMTVDPMVKLLKCWAVVDSPSDESYFQGMLDEKPGDSGYRGTKWWCPHRHRTPKAAKACALAELKRQVRVLKPLCLPLDQRVEFVKGDYGVQGELRPIRRT